jgi:hypothetical protein
MIKNVTPFFLDGGVQIVATAATDVPWNGTSSFVTVAASGARSFLLPSAVGGKKIAFGTMVVVVKSDNNTNAITVNPTNDVSSSVPSVALSTQYQTCMFMFKGPSGSTNTIGEWALLSFGVGGSGGGTFTGGTVSGATVFSSSLEVDGNATFDGGTNSFNGTSSFNAIAQFQGGMHMSAVTITAAGTTQADATAMTAGDWSKTIVTSSPSADNQGIILADNLVVNKVYHVFNTSATNNLKVYPISGGSMNGTSNGSVTIAPKSAKMFFCPDATDNWIAS